MQKFFCVIDKILTDLCKGVSILLLTTMSIVTFIEVIRRYTFGFSFAWAEELVRFFLVWLTFIGGSLALRTKNLVFFDLFIGKLSIKKNFLVCVCLDIVIVFFVSYLLLLSRGFIFQKSILLQRSPGLEVPMIYVYIAIPIGCFFMLFFSIFDLFERIKVLKELK